MAPIASCRPIWNSVHDIPRVLRFYASATRKSPPLPKRELITDLAAQELLQNNRHPRECARPHANRGRKKSLAPLLGLPKTPTSTTNRRVAGETAAARRQLVCFFHAATGGGASRPLDRDRRVAPHPPPLQVWRV